MSKRLFVGGLSWGTTEESLRAAFDSYGVIECKIITHHDGDHAGKSKGFGFVSVENGDAALAEMDGTDLDGRYLRVSEAHQQKKREPAGRSSQPYHEHAPEPNGNSRFYEADGNSKDPHRNSRRNWDRTKRDRYY